MIIEGALADYASTIRTSRTIEKALFSGRSIADALIHCAIRNQIDGAADTATRRIIDALTHLPANPSREPQTQLLVDSYCFTSQPDQTVLNSSEPIVADFVGRLIAYSRMSALGGGSNGRIFVLRGERGCGKTFFLNYLLSRFNNSFSSKKVVVVRVNLTRRISARFDQDIERWFYAQATKVLLKYYEKSSPLRNRAPDCAAAIAPYYEMLLAELESSDEESSLNDAVFVKELFIQSGSGELSDSVSPSICRKVVRIAQSIGICFVCIIDGYDRLGRDVESERRFNDLVTSTREFISRRIPAGVSLVLAMRNSTYVSVQGQLINQAFRADVAHEQYEIRSPPLDQVIRRRFEAVHTALSRGAGELSTRMEELFSEFRLGFESEARFREPIVANMRTCMPNLRAAMQVLAGSFFDLASGHHKHGYRVREQIFRGNMRFPPIVFKIVSADGRPAISPFEVNDLTKYDGLAVPVLYWPQFVENGRCDFSVASVNSWPASMLLASRVLYALDEHGRGGILLHDLAEDLNGGWKYDPGLIQAVCDLLESHLCMLTIDAGEPSNGDGFSRRLIITAHGHNLIHNHARDPAYLHLCALRIPISREIVRLNLLQIARLESVDWGQKVVKCGVTSWIEAKIRNAIFLAVLTQAWCEGDPPTGSKAYIFRAHDAMNRAFGDRVSYVLIQLSKALDQLDVRERRAILGALSRSVEAIKESDYASRP